jgi:hypothetical protein
MMRSAVYAAICPARARAGSSSVKANGAMPPSG